MDLLFLNQSNSNTVLNMPDGRPLYHVDSPFQMFGRTTNLSKFDGRGGNSDVGVVELHGMSSDVVAVWGKDVTPQRQGIFSTGRTFCASNGQLLTWKAESGSAVLKDSEKRPVAVYDGGSSGFFGKARPAKLTIAPAGMAIIDEIVATYLYVDQKREQAKRRQNHNRHHHMSGGGGGTGFGAGGGGGGIGGSSSM